MLPFRRWSFSEINTCVKNGKINTSWILVNLIWEGAVSLNTIECFNIARFQKNNWLNFFFKQLSRVFLIGLTLCRTSFFFLFYFCTILKACIAWLCRKLSFLVLQTNLKFFHFAIGNQYFQWNWIKLLANFTLWCDTIIRSLNLNNDSNIAPVIWDYSQERLNVVVFLKSGYWVDMRLERESLACI